MITELSTRFLDFLAEEEKSLLYSMKTCPGALELFERLDGLYQPIVETAVGSSEIKLGLLAFCHVYYYLGFATLCRGHFASAFNPLRISIDAALVAYRMVEEHKPSEFAFKRKNYLGVKNYLQQKRRTAFEQGKPEIFVKARALLQLHEFCSQFASHADPSAWQNRQIASTGVAMAYFGLRGSPRRFSICAVTCVAAHTLILHIFSGLLLQLKIWPAETMTRLNGLTPMITELGIELSHKGDPLMQNLLSAFSLSSFESHLKPL